MRRPLFQPPRPLTLGPPDGTRHATWLELFYDLVFVATVAEVTRNLGPDISLRGVLRYALLFVPVWWSWIGTTFYADRFDTDDAVHRVLTAVQMLAVGALAVNVHGALSASSTGFALSYAAIRGILILMYLRAWRHLPPARPLVRRYLIGFSIAAALWLVSVLLPPPGRFALWGVALAIDFLTPLSSRRFQAQIPPDPRHLPERFGLFTIIVLGETVLGVVRGVAERAWDIQPAAVAVLGFSVAFSLWWLYFDNVQESVVRRTQVAGQVWIYVHLPLVMAIAAAGVGVEHAVAADPGSGLAAGDRWLLCGSAAVALVAVGIIHLTGVTNRSAIRREVNAWSHAAAATVTLLLAAVGAALTPLLLMGLLAALTATQVTVDIFVTGHQSELSEDLAARE